MKSIPATWRSLHYVVKLLVIGFSAVILSIAFIRGEDVPLLSRIGNMIYGGVSYVGVVIMLLFIYRGFRGH